MNDLIGKLAEAHPATFFLAGADRRPLKIGIHRDLAAAKTLSCRQLKRALAQYTGSLGYLSNMRENAPRVGLDGRPAGTVTAEQELDAIAKVLRIEAENAAAWQRAWENRRKPQERRSPACTPEVKTSSDPPKPQPAPSQRVGLYGLKAAWQARQAAKEAAE
jgi:sRNA-binding protein